MEKEPPFDKNLKTAYRVSYLLAGHIRHTLTNEEAAELQAWVQADEQNKKIFEELSDPEKRGEMQKQYESFDTEKNLLEAKRKLSFGGSRKYRIKYPLAIAASLLLIVSLGLYWLFFPSRNKQELVSVENTIKPAGPATSGAKKGISLELEDGRLIEFNKESVDSLLSGYGSIKANGDLLSYQPMQGGAGRFHRLSVAAGMQYELVLPDGTMVWLNAGSSLRYPLAFDSLERRVELTGEGYFRVAKNKDKPFRVYVNNMRVEATGTAFVINAYLNEHFWRTTLTEGSVIVSRENLTLELKPGFQAISEQAGLRRLSVDTTEALGWVKQQFVFNNTTLDEILRQAERWYDISLEYRTPINEHFTLTMSREEPLSRLLALLEKTGQVHFTLEGKKLIVNK